MCDRKSLRDILSLCAVCALRVCAELAAFDAAGLFSLAKTINMSLNLCMAQPFRFSSWRPRTGFESYMERAHALCSAAHVAAVRLGARQNLRLGASTQLVLWDRLAILC